MSDRLQTYLLHPYLSAIAAAHTCGVFDATCCQAASPLWAGLLHLISTIFTRALARSDLNIATEAQAAEHVLSPALVVGVEALHAATVVNLPDRGAVAGGTAPCHSDMHA